MSSLDHNRPRSTQAKYGRKVEIPDSELRRHRATHRRQPRRGKGKAVLVLLLIIAIVVVSILAYTYLPSSEGNTPEEVFLSIMDAVNDGDNERMIQCSVACFAEGAMKEMACTELEYQLWTFMIWTSVLDSYELVNEDSSSFIQQVLNEISDYNEKTYSVDISDCCAIIAKHTVYYNGNASAEEHIFPFVKIDSDWYLALIPLPEGQTIVEPAEASAHR